ncbi:ralBP1-associated Eps domain-containing protein 2 isoform 1-T1 [Synchiropus picturatus]
MDPDTGVASAASFISLNEHEQRFYSGLHGLCQSDSSAGKLSSSKVAELLKASQLPPEALHKVTEVCGAKRLGYFGTPQFYLALKLLAASQSGLPIRLESVSTNLPLPRFVGLKSEIEMRYTTVQPSSDAQVPTSWADRTTFRPLEANVEKKESWSPRHSPSSSPPQSPLAYHTYQYTKHRNEADPITVYESKPSSRPVVSMEQHSSPSRFRSQHTVEPPLAARASSVERLDQQGVADYEDDDPWRITEEQREYYTLQFKSLQPDLDALILGTVAKNFFTKSKLPIPELSHIWELSDVDRDGALTFSEFCTAFHLIVARKNGYPLPESLPLTLQPGYQDDGILDTPGSIEPLILFDDAETKPKRKTVFERLQPNMLHTEDQESSHQASEVTSSQEKQMLQPPFPERPDPPQFFDPQLKVRTRPRSYSSTSIEDAMKKAEEPPTPPPRPQKTHSRASSLDLNKLFQQGAPGIKTGWMPPPPALPPRPPTSQVPHFVNVSNKAPQNKVKQPNFADFSRFREEEERGLKPAEPGPLSRKSTENLTISSKQEVAVASQGHPPQKPVRRKYHPEGQNPELVPGHAATVPPPAKPAQKLLSRQKREIQMAIRKNKETNAVLTRLNSELQQQLKVVHQERVTLETQLELFRPVAST